MKARKGFTLVEILIVVVILGILAAIVIPQFTDASTQSKLSSCRTTLQSMRSQIELYKIQHNDTPPALATFDAQMTTYSDANGNTAAAKGGLFIYGPYMQRVPTNPWNDSQTLAAADAAGVGWVYDEATGDIYIGVADAPAAVVAELQASGDAL
jgi:general secretion pathway protein G